MGIYDRDYNDKRFEPKPAKTIFGIRVSSSLTNLIVVNITVFIFLYLLYVIYLILHPNKDEMATFLFRSEVLSRFALPGQFSEWLHQPWSVLTFMFTHFEPGMIFSNMLWLWAFGSILEEMTDRKVIAAYLYGSLFAGLVYLLVNTLVLPAVDSDLGKGYYGGAAGVMSVAIAATTLQPGYRLFPNIGKGLPLWVFTLLYVALSLASMPLNYIMAGSGALTGFVMMSFYKKGVDWSDPLERFFHRCLNLFNPDKKSRTLQRKKVLHYQTLEPPYTKTPRVNQNRVDEILDKIHKDGGTHRLTTEEKEILRRAQEEL